MAAGSTDSNGVYQYGSSDSNATFHGLLNIANAILSTTIGALVTRLNNDEAKLRRTVSSLTALDAIADATVGQTAFTTAPGTGVTGHSWVAVGGSGGGLDWQPAGTFVVDTKAHFNTYVAAVVAIGDLTFPVGQLGYVTAEGITYRWNGTAWKAWESDWITYVPTVSGGNNLGSGSTVSARYRYQNGSVRVNGRITLGTTGLSISGPIVLTLPVTFVTSVRYATLGTDRCFAFDTSAAGTPIVFIARHDLVDFSKFNLAPWSGSAASTMNSTTPFTWASSDTIDFDFIGEPA